MANRSPRISVGLPVFNGEKYLQQAIDAILRQTFSDFELIISDNASSDGTEEICRLYAKRDRRIRYYRNATNVGGAKNFNRVYELSVGDYFRWAAYDDLVAPKTLERCFEILERNPTVVLCHSKTINIDQDGNIIDYYDDNFAFRSKDPSRRFRDFLLRVYEYNCNALFGLIRRNALEETSLIGSYHSSDKVLLAQLVLKGEFFEIPAYLFYKRFHPEISTVVCRTENAFAEWHDTSKKDRPSLPTLQRTIDFVKSIQREPLHWQQKLQCHGYLARFYLLQGKRWRGFCRKMYPFGSLAFWANYLGE